MVNQSLYQQQTENAVTSSYKFHKSTDISSILKMKTKLKVAMAAHQLAMFTLSKMYNSIAYNKKID